MPSCDTEKSPDEFDFGIENKFAITHQYHSSTGELSFLISEINDSRCPEDVICIWQGMAEIKIDILKPEKSSLLINTHNNRIDSVSGYSFELKKVEPYPISTQPINQKDYRIFMLINKLSNK